MPKPSVPYPPAHSPVLNIDDVVRALLVFHDTGERGFVCVCVCVCVRVCGGWWMVGACEGERARDACGLCGACARLS